MAPGEASTAVPDLVWLQEQTRPAARPTNRTRAAYTLIGGTAGIGLLATMAHLTGNPFVFPSLGATAFLVFSSPAASASSLRSTLAGHATGALVGLAMLVAFGLYGDGSAIASGVTWAHTAAAALAVGLTGAILVLVDALHPPAGATTLIVSLGLMGTVGDIGVLLLAVVVFSVLAAATNRRFAHRFCP